MLAIWSVPPQVHSIIGTYTGRRRLRDASAPVRYGGNAVPNTNYIRKHALGCLRLATECNNIAGDVRTPDHARLGFLRMALMWMELAVPLPMKDQVK
jgi:hypothetical protein